MGAIAVVGAQWGDEGKGKVTQLIAKEAHATIRYHGGNNAGHTIYYKDKRFPLHLIPCGVFNEMCLLGITNGTVLDLAVLVDEIDLVISAGVELKNRLFISPRAHIIMPYHKILDRVMEEAKGAAKTGTTGRGIGPSYMTKVSYLGIRLEDLADRKVFSEKLKLQLRFGSQFIRALSPDNVALDSLIEDQIYDETMTQYEKISRPGYIHEIHGMIHAWLEAGKNVLFEGAHGVMLDTDWGTYPFVTGSSCVPGSPLLYDRHTQVIGVTKAYTTRVGAGPFPTELDDEIGERLCKNGAEFGTTTGRKRRCGWLDAAMLQYAVSVASVNTLAITKLDVLDDFDEIKICTRYKTPNGGILRFEDLSTSFLGSGELVPVYETWSGWKCSIRNVRHYRDLPAAAQNYISRIEGLTNTYVSIISVGPNAEDTILL